MAGDQPGRQHQRHGADVQGELVGIVFDNAAGQQVGATSCRRFKGWSEPQEANEPPASMRVLWSQASRVGSSWTAPNSRPMPLAINNRGQVCVVQPTQPWQVARLWQPVRAGVLVRPEQKDRVADLGQQREPDVLRIAQQQLRAGQQGNGRGGQHDVPPA